MIRLGKKTKLKNKNKNYKKWKKIIQRKNLQKTESFAFMEKNVIATKGSSTRSSDDSLCEKSPN
jgi:hypothetical protein